MIKILHFCSVTFFLSLLTQEVSFIPQLPQKENLNFPRVRGMHLRPGAHDNQYERLSRPACNEFLRWLFGQHIKKSPNFLFTHPYRIRDMLKCILHETVTYRNVNSLKDFPNFLCVSLKTIVDFQSKTNKLSRKLKFIFRIRVIV